MKCELFAVAGCISCLTPEVGGHGKCSPSYWEEASNPVSFLPGNLRESSLLITCHYKPFFSLVSNSVAMTVSPCVHVQEFLRVYT